MKLNQLLELISLPLTGRAAGHAVTRGEVKGIKARTLSHSLRSCRLPLRNGAIAVATQSPFWLKGVVMALAMTGGSLVTASLATTPTSAASSITLTQPSNITIAPQAGDNGIIYDSHTLTINATDVLSYNVTLKANSANSNDGNNNANLTNQANPNATSITPVGSNKTLDGNQWGYTKETVTDANKASNIWLTPSTTETTILDKKLDIDNNVYNDKTDLTIYYGANVDTNTLAEGSYQATVTYTATAVPKPEEAPTDLGGEICQSGNSENDCQVDIDENMVPVVYAGDTTTPKWSIERRAYIDNSYGGMEGSWYDYSKQKWANAVTLRNDKSAGSYNLVLTSSGDGIMGDSYTYQRKTDGSGKFTPLEAAKKYYDTGSCIAVGCDSYSWQGGGINPDDILGYWVYIPRYDYQVRTLSGAVATPIAQDFTIRFRKAGDSDTKWQTLTPSEAVGNSNDINNKAWATHPAFSWCSTNDDGSKKDCTELNGIWVGKFETTGSIKAPTILPSQYHKAGEYIGTFYDIAKSIGVKDDANPYGNGTETTQNSHSLSTAKTHMLKNNEWGAVAYLSSSKFGAGVNNVKINGNNSSGVDRDGKPSAGTTGCGPIADGSDDSGATCNVYNTAIGQTASTTGNTYGVYDMNGGAFEDVMGNWTNKSGQSSTGTDADNAKYFTNPTKPPYVNLYLDFTNDNDQCIWLTCGGDALYETLKWGGNFAQVATSSRPWFDRGGYYGYGAGSGVFNYSNNTGYDGNYIGFRISLLSSSV